MKTWEYLLVEFSKIEKKGMGFSIASEVGSHPRWINGQEQHDWEQKPQFRQYLVELGQQGWEYSGSGLAEHGGFCCVLKRRVEAPG